ncbi:7521_t:CDS:2 [Gigaspora rosea]|nr:7521_t:CDS:2 [Gigaspora rosea]
MNNEKKTYLSERTLGKGTRFKSESQEKYQRHLFFATKNLEEARVVTPHVKLLAATSRNKRPVQNPETHSVKFQKRKPSIIKTLKSYYVPEILVENDDEGSTNIENVEEFDSGTYKA